MHEILATKWSWIEGTHAMRGQMMDALTDADLAFTPGGQAMTLGALCREMGEVQHAYVQSFKNFSLDFSYRNTEPGIEGSVARLKVWFQMLDDEMKAVLSAMSDEDAKRTIDRSGYPAPMDQQLEIYLQALLIWAAKTTIYFKAMSKPLPGQVNEWI